MEETPISIPLKEKYLVAKPGRSGPYRTRTGMRKRPGYHKHAFAGKNHFPYPRIKGY